MRVSVPALLSFAVVREPIPVIGGTRVPQLVGMQAGMFATSISNFEVFLSHTGRSANKNAKAAANERLPQQSLVCHSGRADAHNNPMEFWPYLEHPRSYRTLCNFKGRTEVGQCRCGQPAANLVIF